MWKVNKKQGFNSRRLTKTGLQMWKVKKTDVEGASDVEG